MVTWAYSGTFIYTGCFYISAVNVYYSGFWIGFTSWRKSNASDTGTIFSACHGQFGPFHTVNIEDASLIHLYTGRNNICIRCQIHLSFNNKVNYWIFWNFDTGTIGGAVIIVSQIW